MKSHGLIIPTVMHTVIVLKIPCAMKIQNGDSTKSITAISFEKRVTMRPTGFWSKNKISALSTLFATKLCKLVPDVMTIQKTTSALIKQKTM